MRIHMCEYSPVCGRTCTSRTTAARGRGRAPAAAWARGGVRVAAAAPMRGRCVPARQPARTAPRKTWSGWMHLQYNTMSIRLFLLPQTSQL